MVATCACPDIYIYVCLKGSFSGSRFYFQCLAISLAPSRQEPSNAHGLAGLGESFLVFLNHHLVPRIQRNPDPTVGSPQAPPGDVWSDNSTVRRGQLEQDGRTHATALMVSAPAPSPLPLASSSHPHASVSHFFLRGNVILLWGLIN